MGSKLGELYPRQRTEERRPESASKRQRRANCHKVIAEHPGCLATAIVINFSPVDLLVKGVNEHKHTRPVANRIAMQLGQHGFTPQYLGIAAVHSGNNHPGRPAPHFEYCADQLASAFAKPGRMIEILSFDQTAPLPQGADPLWAPLEDFAMHKVEPGQKPPDTGFVAVAGAKTAALMMGFEPGSPQDVALHAGAVLLSTGVPLIDADGILTHQKWIQLPLTADMF